MAMGRKTRIILALGLTVIAMAMACNSGGTDSSPGEPSTPAAPATPERTPVEPNATSPTDANRETVAEATTTQEASPTPVPTSTPTTSPAEDVLRGARFSTLNWSTDFGKHSVPYDEIFSGGPGKDGIPAIDNPTFVSVGEADEWLADVEPVQIVAIGGEAKAYPLQILMWHEIVNDEVGDKPVSITFCPLCNTAITFDRELPGGTILDFGATGNLRHSDLVMYDRQTESWWQQITGEAIVGELTGTKLEVIASPLTSFSEFKKAHPEGSVLSRETGYSRPYGTNPYTRYDTSRPFLFAGPEDGRLNPTERVATVSAGDESVAFPFSVLEDNPVVSYTLNNADIVVFYQKGTASALDSSRIADGRDVGSTGVFLAAANGRQLTFRRDGGGFVDNETGSTWNILGKAIDGELKGTSLEPVAHANHFWFAWAVFNPDTILYRG